MSNQYTQPYPQAGSLPFSQATYGTPRSSESAPFGHAALPPHHHQARLPAASVAIWRTHCPTTSFDSDDSARSGAEDGWFTVDQDTSSNSDTSDPDAQGSMPIVRAAPGSQLSEMPGNMAPSADCASAVADMGRRSSRIAGKPPVALSIDPNLFRPRHDVRAHTLTVTSLTSARTAKPLVNAQPASPPEDGEGDDDEPMCTAKPKKKGAAVSNRSKGAKSKKISHARKHGAEHIPRPRNAFILFRKHIVDAKLIPASVEIRHQNVSVIVAKMWADAPAAQKAEFNELARLEKEEHMKKYPGYRYQPVYRRTNVIRRRVRKDEAEEEKCKSVAALLLKGTSGEKLEEEIKVKMQQPELQAKLSRKSSGANELSKGALRALKAQARQETASIASQSQSRASSQRPSVSSRAESAASETDSEWQYDDVSSRLSSAASDLSIGQPKLDFAPFGGFPGQLAAPYPGTTASAFTGLPAYGSMQMPVGYVWPGQQGVQQTWAYPEQEPNVSSGMLQMPAMAYQQPTTQINAFFSYDQALPFSPTAHSFDQSFPLHGASEPPFALDGPAAFTMSYDHLLQPQQAGMGHGQPFFPPQSAKWDAAFRPGVEGLPFDDTGILGDFGAALMQAEETGGW